MAFPTPELLYPSLLLFFSVWRDFNLIGEVSIAGQFISTLEHDFHVVGSTRVLWSILFSFYALVTHFSFRLRLVIQKVDVDISLSVNSAFSLEQTGFSWLSSKGASVSSVWIRFCIVILGLKSNLLGFKVCFGCPQSLHRLSQFSINPRFSLSLLCL